MNNRNRTARLLVAIGSIVLAAAAALHSLAGYPRVSSALNASNLIAPVPGALRAVFLLVGWDWIVIAVVALLVAFTETKLRKILVLICGVALLVAAGVILAFVGVFIGTEMIAAAAVFIILGGLLFENV